MSASYDMSRLDREWDQLLDWLVVQMRRRGLTSSQLARGAGVPLSTLSGLLSGRHRPSLETLDRLARYFGRPLAELRELAEDSPGGDVESRPLGPSDARFDELGWILHDLAPRLTADELEWFLDYARHLRDSKLRGHEAGTA